MARGWESKSVASQIESAQSQTDQTAGGKLTPEQLTRRQQRKSLELSRTRVRHDLASATNPRYREQLKAALAHLDKKIKALEDR